MTDTTIGEATLAALQQTHAVRRLERVSQAGAPSLFRPTRSLTRYEHSIGVMRLARRVGLPVDQQVIALLHDTTHSAFSHTLDYLLAASAEDTHETHASRLLTDRELIAELGTDGVGRVVDAITTKPGWLRILDAVDYTLRDLRRAGLLDTTTTREVLAALTLVDHQVCFASTDAASTFTTLMAYTNSRLYMDAADLFFHAALSELLTKAIEHETFTIDELMTSDDATVLARLAATPSLRGDLAGFRSHTPGNLRERRDGQRITSKARLLDPPVKVSDALAVPLSELAPAWRKTWDAARRRAEQGAALLTPT